MQQCQTNNKTILLFVCFKIHNSIFLTTVQLARSHNNFRFSVFQISVMLIMSYLQICSHSNDLVYGDAKAKLDFFTQFFIGRS